MKTIFHPAEKRGHANHGWLDTYHSFSFAGWYDASRVQFGELRVLNDDVIEIGEGFGTHPHDNMEIVSIPLKGILAHRDSTGSEGLIYAGDVQIMSAGTGICHSEYNGSPVETTSFLQIWVFPKKKDIVPRYDQKRFDPDERKDKWQILVSPDEKDNALWINQNAVFSRVALSAGTDLEYDCKFKGNRVYLFVLEGSVEAGNRVLNRRDALGISEAAQFGIKALSPSDLLAIEIP